MLGGLRYLIPVIQSAHKLGYNVITCDNVPNNIAHSYSDEYHNISILDKDTVLTLAQQLKIDGVISFAVDPGVLTAAYVAERLNLPFAGSYESIKVLQNKDLFRAFLAQHGFNVPVSGGYHSLEEVLSEVDKFQFPVIVKPVDSAGSKGVNRVDCLSELDFAVREALRLSFSKRCIVEEFIEQKGFSSDSDCFSLDGKLVFTSFSDQIFDAIASNPYTPAAYVWPNSMSEQECSTLTSDLQRLFHLLKLKSSIYNIETRIGKNGKAYIMEVSPRGGGNRIAEILKLSTNINLIEAAVKTAVGDSTCIPSSYSYNGIWAELVLYSDKNGFYDSIQVDESVSKFLFETDIWVKSGDRVSTFTGANETIGTLIFKFDSRTEFDEYWPGIRTLISLKVY